MAKDHIEVNITIQRCQAFAINCFDIQTLFNKATVIDTTLNIPMQAAT